MKEKSLFKIGTIAVGLLAVAGGAFYFLGQKFSADDSGTYSEAGTINYSFRMVGPSDQTKGLEGVQAVISTDATGNRVVKSDAVNRNIAYRNPVQSDKVTSDSSGLISGGNYSICTKDNSTFVIMTKGCEYKVSVIKVTLPSVKNTATISKKSSSRRQNKETANFSMPVGFSYDIPTVQFKDLYSSVENGTGNGITGKWTMKTSLVYSDGTGGKAANDYSQILKKFYEVGTIDIPVQLVTSAKDKTPVVGRDITIQAYDSSPQKIFSSFYKFKAVYSYSYSQSDSNHLLTQLTTSGSTDAQGMVTGHYKLCFQNKKYFIMSTGCTYKIRGLAMDVALPASTSSSTKDAAKDPATKKVTAQPFSGNGFSQKDFTTKYAPSDGSTSFTGGTINGSWKAKSPITIFADSTGLVKLIQDKLN